MLEAIKQFFRNARIAKRRKVVIAAFTDGRVLSRFIAKDVQREVRIVGVDEIDSGFVIAQIRTTNILYLSHKLTQQEPFGPPERLSLDDIWNWTGQSWGGLPDGTSIADNEDTKAAVTPNDG